MAADVVKQGSRVTEPFNRSKLHDSIYATCLSVRSLEGIANDTADSVCDKLATWLENKPEITSSDIRRQATAILEKLHPDAAYLYKHHKRII